MSVFNRERPTRGVIGAHLDPSYSPAMGLPPQGTLGVAIVQWTGKLPMPQHWLERPVGWYITRANDPVAGPFATSEDAAAYRDKCRWTPA